MCATESVEIALAVFTQLEKRAISDNSNKTSMDMAPVASAEFYPRKDVDDVSYHRHFWEGGGPEEKSWTRGPQRAAKPKSSWN